MLKNRDPGRGSEPTDRINQHFEPRQRKRMFGRIGNKALARICHNVGGGLHAGVEIRRIFETESNRGTAQQRVEMTKILDRVNEGDTLTAALAGGNGYFPPLLIEMVDVGERTGRLERVFFKLADHYDQLVKMKRDFISGIAWPLFELTIAVLVIGVMILVLGFLGDPPAITVFGLYGGRGLMIYLGVIGVIVGSIAGLIFAVKNEWINVDPFIRMLMQVPGIGPGIKTLAMSRLIWALAMATDTDIDPRKAIELSVKTTQNTYYTSQIKAMQDVVTGGGELTDAFQRTQRFPDDFLDALQTGEIAGRISETLEILAKEYEERTKTFFRMLTAVAGVLVFLTIAAVIGAIVIAIYSQYIGALYEYMP